MKIIKGFASDTRFTNNIKDETYPIGELSTYSRTYAKDRGIYTSNDDENLRLITFTCTEDGEHLVLDQDWVEHILEICKYVTDKALSGDKNWTVEAHKNLLLKFSGVASKFKVGKPVTTAMHSVPEWVQWKRNGYNNSIRVYFADNSFRELYDDYEIEVVLPIENIDDFFKARKVVEDIVKRENDPVSMAERGNIVEDKKPETIFKSYMFDWHDINDPDYRLPVRFDILIYGIAGDNIDAIKDRIVEEILEKSIYGPEEWKKRFPEIFRRTEFTIVPRWDNYAIPNRTTIEGIYSPVVRYNNATEVIAQYAHEKYGYTEEHIRDKLTIMSQSYRSLQLLVVSHPENLYDYNYITDVYPDIINQHSLSQDFNRMEENTRIFSEGLNDMIVAAEYFNQDETVPRGMTKLFREKKLYLAKRFGKVNVLVATKINMYPNVD